MSLNEFDSQIKDELAERVIAVESAMSADVMFYYGPIVPGIQRRFREFIEQLKNDGSLGRSHLVVFLNSPGGSVETVEKLVEIIRHHYSEVSFVVPDEAMSAGTVFCMAGDRIYLDYTSSLGPIDPQVHNGKEFVPALGYLDQVERMIRKSSQGTLTTAELIVLQNLDLAMLSRFEQAKNLTVTLLKKWLVEYKFRDWTEHHTNPEKLGKPVTREEKEQRAEEIATMLSDNKLWHSHARMIGLNTIRDTLKLLIEDYSENVDLRRKILGYSNLLTEYVIKNEYPVFLHSRCYF